MDPDTIGALLDAAIPLAGGGYAALLGFRKIGRKPGADPKYDAWHAKYGNLLRKLGPAVMLFGGFLAVNAVL